MANHLLAVVQGCLWMLLLIIEQRMLIIRYLTLISRLLPRLLCFCKIRHSLLVRVQISPPQHRLLPQALR